jgi:hypothetical protein
MASLHPQEIEHLKHLLSEHHSRHEREHGSVDRCQDPSCVEAKMGLSYLGSKIAPPQDFGPSAFNLK